MNIRERLMPVLGLDYYCLLSFIVFFVLSLIIKGCSPPLTHDAHSQKHVLIARTGNSVPGLKNKEESWLFKAIGSYFQPSEQDECYYHKVAKKTKDL